MAPSLPGISEGTSGDRRKSVFPVRPIKIPNLEVQFLIFSLRNFKCKFSRVDNLIYTLLSGPLIALILGFFLRKTEGKVYGFSANDNLPAYQFISIMVAMFLGIVISAGEILKERNIIRKEQFLRFQPLQLYQFQDRFSVGYCGTPDVSLYHCRECDDGHYRYDLSYWLVLFSVACFGVLAGLLFSSWSQT